MGGNTLTGTDIIMRAHTTLFATNEVYKNLVKNVVEKTGRAVPDWNYDDWMAILEDYQNVTAQTG